ncbi:MAG: hypothetical protein P8Y00_09420 [Deltaproteobacteria bacterium]
MQISCAEHRKSMELLGLKIRLKEGRCDSEERKTIEERIEELEKELKMD